MDEEQRYLFHEGRRLAFCATAVSLKTLFVTNDRGKLELVERDGAILTVEGAGFRQLLRRTKPVTTRKTYKTIVVSNGSLVRLAVPGHEHFSDVVLEAVNDRFRIIGGEEGVVRSIEGIDLDARFVANLKSMS